MGLHSAWPFLACDKVGKAGEAPAREHVRCTEAEFVPNKDREFSTIETFFLASAKPKL